MKPTMKQCFGGLVGVVLALGVLPGAGAALPTGKPAPQFVTKTLEGKPFRLESLRGKVVVLDFWAVGCPPCRVQMPRLQVLQRKYHARGLRIVGLTQMDPKPQAARKALRELGVTYPALVDPGERIGKKYQLEAHPTTVLIDREGVVRFVGTGFLIGDEKELEKRLLPLLSQRAGVP